MPRRSYLCLGTQTANAGPVSDYTGQDIYYRSIQHAGGEAEKHDRLTIHDYLWRWDTDWFWCSRAFGAQNPAIRRLWPRRYRRSSFYWKLIGYDRRFDIADRIEGETAARPANEWFKMSRCRWSTARNSWTGSSHVPIEPIWLCPLRLRDPQTPTVGRCTRSAPGNLRQYRVLVVGAYRPDSGHTNRMIEEKVSTLDGHKSLYSDAYYTAEEFAELYGGETYKTAKKTYDPDSRLLDLYAKAVQGQ